MSSLTRKFPGFTVTLRLYDGDKGTGATAHIELEVLAPGSMTPLCVRYSLGKSQEPSPELLELCFRELLGDFGIKHVLPAFYPGPIEVMNHTTSPDALKRHLAARALQLGLFGPESERPICSPFDMPGRSPRPEKFGSR